MFRLFAVVFAVFLLYWALKGAWRRLFAPPRQRRDRRFDGKGPARPVVEKRENSGIDYSKVKDASYRDLKD
ncbi:MAG: hypothetical protein JWQ98_487 [Chlorobi bacterium]|nr:hypothetical protein [Chlorobiota bacterium]